MAADLSGARLRIRALQRTAVGSYLLLILLSLAWEGWLAPKGPPGFWLALKSLPLLLPLFGLLRGRLRSYVYASLLLLLYLTEGLVIVWTEAARAAGSGMLLSLAATEVVLALLCFGCATFYVRLRRAEGATLDA
jgi:uncharacterized membrane protein